MEKNKIVLFNDKKDCTGCGCCFLVCPSHAIKMETDEEGFDYPNIDHSKCIKCSLCVRSCPIIGKDNERD